MTRAQIAFTTEFDDVPEEVSRLIRHPLEETFPMMGLLTESIDTVASGNTGEVKNTILVIEGLRGALVALDIRLAECSGLLKGFQEEKERIFAAGVPPMPESENDG